MRKIAAAALAVGVLAVPSVASAGDEDVSRTTAGDGVWSDPVRYRPTGCVSDTDKGKLRNGLAMSSVHRIAGADALTSARHMTYGQNRYIERVYVTCRPNPRGRTTLITRFQYYFGVWRTILVDDHVGPEGYSR